VTSATVPQAVQSCHELLLWLIRQLDKFPRVRRFTLGERLECSRAGRKTILYSPGSMNSPQASRASG
jgi:hypothetical protein